METDTTVRMELNDRDRRPCSRKAIRHHWSERKKKDKRIKEEGHPSLRT